MPDAHPGSGDGGGGTSRGLFAAFVGLTGSFPSRETGLRVPLTFAASGEKLCTPVHQIAAAVSETWSAAWPCLRRPSWMMNMCSDVT